MATQTPAAVDSSRRLRRVLAAATALVTLALSAPLVFLIPPGEAPDEPAHLAYVDHLLRERSLPAVSEAGPDGYESYQPPLAYVAMAASAAAAGHRAIDYPFARDPAFTFGGAVRRMILQPEPSARVERALAAVRAARSANLLWGAIASGATLLLCLRLASGPWIALAAGAPFCVAPQLLFASATATNDALLVALAALTLAALARVLSSVGSAASAAAASTSAGLALGVKASAAVLAPAVLLTAIALAVRRRGRSAAALVIPGLALTLTWVALNLARSGAAIPVPTAWESVHVGTLARLVSEPWWIVQVWVGFWAKLGWFNVPLPMAAYLLFVPATVLAAVGVATPFTRAHPESRERAVLAALTFVVAANLALLVVYLLTVDWQPQGRYLLPSLPALAGLATAGLDSLRSRFALLGSRLPALAAVSLMLALAGAVLTLRQSALVY